MHISRIKETCIYISDIEKTKQFYHNKLGLSVISVVPGRHIFFRAGESVLLCFIAEQTEKEKVLPPHGAFGRIHFAFEVPGSEYENALQKMQEQSIQVIHQHTWPNGIRSFYFSDPDGNLVEFIEEGLWDA